MEYLTLTCWSCPVTFTTANERSNHHLDYHERSLRRDGTPLVPQELAPVVGYTNGTHPPTWAYKHGGKA